jgi:hypothetical protein
MKSALRFRGSPAASAFVFFAATLFSPRPTLGQSVYGTITGSVSDSSQAAVVGAQVVAASPENGFTRETLSNSTGVYTLPNLLPGTYTLTVTAPGFQTYRKTEVAVTVQTLARVDAVLAIGGVNETVTVVSDAATMQTDRADVHSEITDPGSEQRAVADRPQLPDAVRHGPRHFAAAERTLVWRQPHAVCCVHGKRGQRQFE